MHGSPQHSNAVIDDTMLSAQSVETHRAAPNSGTEPETIAGQDGVGRSDARLTRPTEEPCAERLRLQVGCEVERHGLGKYSNKLCDKSKAARRHTSKKKSQGIDVPSPKISREPFVPLNRFMRQQLSIVVSKCVVVLRL